MNLRCVWNWFCVHSRPCLYVNLSHVCMSTLMYALAVLFLILINFQPQLNPFTPVMKDTPSLWPPVCVMTILVPTVMQESTLSHNEFVLYLESLLRPFSALSACEFVTCMQALIPYPVPACLPFLPRPSLTPSPSDFKSLYLRALTPTHVPAGVRQCGSWSGQPVWPITGLTTRVFRRPLLLSTLHVVEYSDDIVFCSTLHIFRITCLSLSLTIILWL